VALFLAWSVLFLSGPALAEEPVYTVDISHWQGEITPDEVACMWDSGVRHLIAGVLNPSIAANQLETASNGGMTVDIYVYLYWSGNITAQVQNALAVGAPFPVQRLWLDAENAPGSFTHAQIVEKLQEAVNACGSTPCGIYTRKVWWRDNTGNSTAFSHLPIWYAYYDNMADFDDWYYPSYWYEGPFGGWTDPTGKQYNDRPYLCGSGVDHNIMYTAGDAPPPPDPEVPPAPTGLAPDGASFANDSSVTLSSDPITGVTQYEFEIWYQSAGTWYQYYTYAPNTNSQTFWPAYNNTAYQWHVRAHNATGVGPWSAWATFNLGNVATLPPAPTGLSPADGATITTTSVTLSVSPIAGATNYEFEIWYQNMGVFDYYYTYSTTTNSQTFWPSFDDIPYQWKARAKNGSGWGEWSDFSTFNFGNVQVTPPPAPTGLSPANGQSFENNSSVTLTCNEIADASEYEFEISYKSAGTWYDYYTYGTGTNAKTFWPSYDDTPYRWKGRAKNTGGWGEWSAWATFNMGIAPPVAPTGLTASAISSSRIDLSWTDASSDETGFKIQRKIVGGTFSTIKTVGANVTSYSNTGLTPDTLYRYRVRAYNEAGKSAFTNTASATTLTGLPAPTGLSPNNGQVISSSAVVLSSGAVSGATQYKFRIEYKSGGSWVYYYAYTSATNSKTFYPKVHGTDYRFRVRAQNASITGPWSAWANFYFK
jgi:hypothetical protein